MSTAPGGTVSLTGIFASGIGVITPGNIAVASGAAVTVSPAATTTYTLTVTGVGKIATQTATVTVNAAAPTITSFAANPATIAAGGSSSLIALFANGTGAITPGNIAVTSGTAVTVSPTATTTYTLTVTGGTGQTITQTVTVTVNAAVAVNGVCGSANGTPVDTAPTANLCTAGTASSVTGSGPWDWNCNGSSGGSNASCSAPPTGNTSHDIYVNNEASNASDSNSGTQASPLLTIQAGVNMAKPGYSVLVMPGTYTEQTVASDVSTQGIQIRLVGTASSPITIAAQTPGTVVIDQKSGAVGFEILNSAYITISGFTIQNCYGGGVHMEEGAASTQMTVTNNNVQHCDGVAGDNIGGIYIGGCTYCTIANNVINDIKVGGVYSMNGAGIHGYSQAYCTLDSNQISNAYTGIFHKRSSGQQGLLITNNTITGVTLGILYSVGGAGDPPHINQRVFNNVINASGNDISATVSETSSPSQGLTIKHNLLLGAQGVFEWGYQGVSIADNIFYNLTSNAIATESGTWSTELAAISNNLYYPSATFWLQEYGTGSMQYTSLASFLSATGFGNTNFIADPLFVNPGSDWHLQAGSAAIGAADDGTDIGPYGASGSAVVNAACGSANGTTVGSAPTANLCVTGESSNVVGAGPWNWWCTGSNGGGGASCSAFLGTTQGNVNRIAALPWQSR